MFVDELTIEAKAGNGGSGVVRWLRLRHMPKGGPAGGNGGNGGDVYMRAVRDLNLLSKYTGSKLFVAENGEAGHSRSKFGKNGEDCYIDVPIGSTVTNTGTGEVYFFEKEAQIEKILQGGQGGLGNEHFKSSTNRSPKESTKGKPGEVGTFTIELAIIADVGLVGYPNAGKSTLLNAFTHATSAVGAYPFTTLEPHLGDLYGFTLADVPGLIEGASEGKGLGHKFLRHVGKTKMLLHLVSIEHLQEGGEEKLIAAYETIRTEIKKFGKGLDKKEEWIVLTKIDVCTEEEVSKAIQTLRLKNPVVHAISVESGAGVKELQDILIRHLRERTTANLGE